MSLEATLICLDNSEWMRNGDYTPTRLEAQIDAANAIIRHKTQRQDNTVGLMTYAGKTPEVLVSPTSEDSKISAIIHNIKIQGESKFENCLQIAQLVLKHRQNKHQQQRIVIFVASPIKESEEELVKLGKKLKKNNVAVDVISFGEDQRGILEPFISSVKSGDNSHLLIVPPGPHLLSEVILTSPIIGIDPSSAGSQFGDFGMQGDDPDLLLALRISMEEERQRREKALEEERKKNQGSQDVKMGESETKPSGSNDMDLDEEQELQRALALSQTEMDAEEEEMLKKALEMSEEKNENVSELLQDSNVLANILVNLPGVDPNDPRIKNTLQNIASDPKKDEQNDDSKKEQK